MSGLFSQWDLFSHWLHSQQELHTQTAQPNHEDDKSSVSLAAFYVQVEVKQHGSSLEGKPLAVVQVCSLIMRGA